MKSLRIGMLQSRCHCRDAVPRASHSGAPRGEGRPHPAFDRGLFGSAAPALWGLAVEEAALTSLRRRQYPGLQIVQEVSVPRMVVLHARDVAGRWYGVACADERLVATAVSSTREGTLRHLRRSLPAGVAHRQAGEGRSGFAEETIAQLVELEAGREEQKAFSLATDYVGEPLAGVLKVAAAIPLGYVSSYGDIARASRVEARDVGKIMASNPLYPIVPCHRVVGADLALVGYSGSRGPAALRAKLARLSREARGYTAELDVLVEGRPLRVYPVEWAIAAARKHAVPDGRQRTLFGVGPGAGLLLAASALLTACAAAGTGDASTDHPFETVLTQAHSGLDERRREVVRDEAAWARQWADVHANVTPAPPLPPVDFGRSMLILVASGTRPSGGFAISVRKVTTRRGSLEVAVFETCPAPGDVVTQEMTQPVEVVRVPNLPEPATFQEARGGSCP